MNIRTIKGQPIISVTREQDEKRFEAIIGFDFLQATGAVIDLNTMEIR